VGIVDNLSQHRSLVLIWNGQAVEPDVRPVFVRTPATEEDAKDRLNGTTTLYIQRDTIKAIEGVAFAWLGTVYSRPGDQTELGEAILIHGEDRQITGTISIEGDFYHIRPLSSGLHALVEDDESKYPSGADPRKDGKVDPRYSGSASFQGSPSDVNSKSMAHSSVATPASEQRECTAPAALEGIDIGKIATEIGNFVMAPCLQASADVLVVYTQDAAGGRDIDGIINQVIQEAEAAYDNSNIDGHYTFPNSVDVNLAHKQQVSFDEGADIEEDMEYLVADATIQSLRNQYNADIVVLITEDVYRDEDGNAIGGVVAEIRPEAGDAYAIVAAPYATGGHYAFVHEVGHLQGAQHNPEAACVPGSPWYPACDAEGDLFSYAYGHYFTASGNRRRTVMSYNVYPGYSTILHFSNPSVTYNGAATGTSSRNNAAALQATASTVESFRVSDRLEAAVYMSGDWDGGVRHFDGNPCGGTGTYSYSWQISYYGPFNYGSTVSTQETFTHIFPEGTHYVRLVVTSGSQTDTAGVAVSVDCQPGHQCGSPSPASMLAATASGSPKQSLAASQSEGMTHPTEVALHAVAPNPVRTSTQIRFDLPEPAHVELTVYDLMGRAVKQLATGSHSPGTHSVGFDATTLPSGVYIVHLQAGSRQVTRRITVVK